MVTVSPAPIFVSLNKIISGFTFSSLTADGSWLSLPTAPLMLIKTRLTKDSRWRAAMVVSLSN